MKKYEVVKKSLDFNDIILDIAKMVDPLEVFTQMQNYMQALL